MTPARGWFYPGMAVAIALTVFAGFAPTYYLGSFLDAPVLSGLAHAHGIAFTAWVVLLASQVSLVAAGRRDIHRRLGVAGAALAVAMVGLGIAVALAAARRDIGAGRADEALSFLIIPLGDIVAFAVLVGCGFFWRMRTEIHKRLMLLATLALLPAAIGRIPYLEDPGPFIAYFLILLAAAPAHDRLQGRRPHPVSLWGGIGVFAFELGRFMVSETAAWRAIAERLV